LSTRRELGGHAVEPTLVLEQLRHLLTEDRSELLFEAALVLMELFARGGKLALTFTDSAGLRPEVPLSLDQFGEVGSVFADRLELVGERF
jgi:hypothetical protein